MNAIKLNSPQFDSEQQYWTTSSEILSQLTDESDEILKQAFKEYEQVMKHVRKEINGSFNEVVELEGILRGHGARIAILSLLINQKLEGEGLPYSDPDVLARTAFLHDVGKLHNSIHTTSLKTGEYNDIDRIIMRGHPKKGSEMVDRAYGMLKNELGEDVRGKLGDIINGIRFHHEGEDGKGYEGLASEDIPMQDKIVAVADIFDAMLSERPYDNRDLSTGEAISQLKRAAHEGRLDAVVVQALIDIKPDESSRGDYFYHIKEIPDPIPATHTVEIMELLDEINAHGDRILSASRGTNSDKY